MPFPPNFTNAWDTTFPPDTQAANQLGLDLRNFRTDIMQRMSLLSGTFANRPTPETVNAVWGGAGFGLLYFSTDTAQIFQWSGVAWVDVTALLLGTSFGSASGGVRIVAAINLVAQSASIAATPLYNVPSGSPGLYRLIANLVCTTAGTGNVFPTFFWNNGAAAQSQQVGGIAFGLGAENPNLSTLVIRSAGAQAINYSVTSSAGGGAQFSLSLRVEYLG